MRHTTGEGEGLKTIGLFPNTSKPSVGTVLAWLIQYCKEHEVPVLLPEAAAAQLGHSELGASLPAMLTKIDMAITFGGDGTLLNTAREVASAGVPICGINMGQLGFLTEAEVPELAKSMDVLLAGNYRLEERLMLDAFIERNGERHYVSAALNDVVISKTGISRLVKLKLYVDDHLAAHYAADGLIISTATGSTGYSLSAGGPILNPNLPVIMITPICPHTLQSRSLVVTAEETVRVKTLYSHPDLVLSIDGQAVHPLQPEDEIIVEQSPVKAKFIRFNGRSYYETLRTKLWRGMSDADF